MSNNIVHILCDENGAALLVFNSHNAASQARRDLEEHGDREPAIPPGRTTTPHWERWRDTIPHKLEPVHTVKGTLTITPFNII